MYIYIYYRFIYIYIYIYIYSWAKIGDDKIWESTDLKANESQ